MTDWKAELEKAGLKPVTRIEGDTRSMSEMEFVRGYEPYADKTAGVLTAMGAGTIEDKDALIDYFARNRFPDDPKAKDRYGFHNGDVVFVDDDGKLQRETAGGTEFAKAVGEFGLQAIGGIAGAFGGPLASGVGAAGGLAWRKNIGRGLGDKQTALGNSVDIAVEGVLSAAGAKAGDVFAKGVVNRRVASDLSRYDDALTREIIDKGKSLGIEVTPAEASNLGSLIRQQTRMTGGFDEAGDILRDFYTKRAGQEAAAIDDFIGKTPNASVAGGKAREVAAQTIDDAYAARSTAAGPLYKTGVADDILVPDEILMRIENDPLIAQHIARIRGNPEFGLEDVNPRSTRFLDELKKSLDARAKQLKIAGEDYRAGQVSDAAKRVRELTDDIYPVYGEARSAFASQSPEIQALEEGVEGVIARMRDPSLRRVAKTVFNPAETAPDDIARLRRHFVSQGRTDDWNDLLNVYLRNTWETQKGRMTDDFGVSGKWRQMVYGSKRARENMKAAMGPGRFKDFENLMDVLEATSRVPKGQSMTEPARQAAEREAFDAAPIASSSKGFGVGGLREWWINAKVDAWRSDIAKVMTNAESLSTLQQLRQLKSLNPKSAEAIRVVSVALTQAGVAPGRAALSSRSSQVPPVIHQGRILSQ